MDQLQLLKRQYLQLLDPEQLSLPPADVIRLPYVQAQIYETMFRDGCLSFPPPDRYKLRVLKMLVQRMEAAIDDPEEDEISDDLTACLSNLMSQSQIPASVAAQQKQYVTYTLPELTSDARTITTLEARAILASSGTTGLRTWEAALHLGTFLSSPRGLSLVKKQNVLELGAGTGFISMLCAKSLGAEHVLATDGSAEVMDDMKANLYLNGLEGSVLIDTIALKWGHALIGEFFDDSEAGPRFDVVLGADVTYDQRSIMPLVSTLKDLFMKYPDSQAIIAATVRNEDTLKSFEEACNASKFTLELVFFPDDEQRGLFYPKTTPISLTNIRPFLYRSSHRSCHGDGVFFSTYALDSDDDGPRGGQSSYGGSKKPKGKSIPFGPGSEDEDESEADVGRGKSRAKPKGNKKGGNQFGNASDYEDDRGGYGKKGAKW